MSLEIARATSPSEREDVFRQRYAVYTEEMGMLRSVADHEQRLLVDDLDEAARIFCARDGERTVGSCRLYLGKDAPLPEKYTSFYDLDRFLDHVPVERIGVASRFCVLSEHRTGRTSLQLIKAATDHCCAEGVELVFQECAPHLISLYTSLGFRRYKGNINDPEFGILTPLCILLSDRPHLERVSSPLLPIVEQYHMGGETPAWAEDIFGSHVARREKRREEVWAKTFGALNTPKNAKQSIFADMTEEEVADFVSRGNIITCKRGEALIRQGTPYQSLFLILKGLVDVCDGDTVIVTLGEGELVGEMAFLLDIPRTVDIRAASDDVEVLNIRRRDISRVDSSQPELSARFSRNLSKLLAIRLIATTQKVGG